MADVVMFGAGKVAQVAKYYLDRFSDHRIVGFAVDAAYRTANSFEGLPLVAWETLEEHFPPAEVKLFGPMTYQRLNEVRRDRYHEGLARGYRFISFIHPHSHVSTDDIGDNCFILEANTIQPFVRIGNNVMIWSGNHIGHHAVIADHVFIASQVGIAGSTVIGEQCHLSGQVGVIHDLVIGKRCCLLNGAFVKQSLPDDTVVTGRAGDIQRYTSARLRRFL